MPEYSNGDAIRPKFWSIAIPVYGPLKYVKANRKFIGQYSNAQLKEYNDTLASLSAISALELAIILL